MLDDAGFQSSNRRHRSADQHVTLVSSLRRPASVVRNRRHVADRLHFETDRLQRADRRLAAGPGPLTRTSSERIPTVFAALPALSAACVAANGVPLREPLKPMPPALDHATTLPSVSVIVTVGVVERRLDVRQPVVDDALLAALLEGLLALSGSAFFLLGCRTFGCRRCVLAIVFSPCSVDSSRLLKPSSSSRSRPCAGPCASARWSASAGRAPAARGGAACRGSSRSPSAA